MNLTMGGSAGVIAVTITYPTDFVRRLMQVSGTPGHPKYSSMIDAFSTVYRKEGIKGWYRGYFACLLKVAPSVAILFWCNEQLKSYVS